MEKILNNGIENVLKIQNSINDFSIYSITQEIELVEKYLKTESYSDEIEIILKCYLDDLRNIMKNKKN